MSDSVGREEQAPRQISDEAMLDQFEKLTELGVIEYVIPSEPIGEGWVLGVEGDIAKLDPEQAFAFLLGSTATANFVAQHQGVTVPIAPSVS